MTSSRATLQVLVALLDDVDGDHYGLELIKVTGLKSGTLYPILGRLEDRGWTFGRWEDITPEDAGRSPPPLLPVDRRGSKGRGQRGRRRPLGAHAEGAEAGGWAGMSILAGFVMLVGGGVLTVVVLVATKVIDLEHSYWSGPVCRFFIRLAARIEPKRLRQTRAAEWHAEIDELHAQHGYSPLLYTLPPVVRGHHRADAGLAVLRPTVLLGGDAGLALVSGALSLPSAS